MALIVDTGVLLAAADRSDGDHERSTALLRSHRGEFLVPAPVVAETSWQVESKLGPQSEAAFIRLITSGVLTVIDLAHADWERCVDLIEGYHDLGLGLVDASVVAVAERLGITTVATLNRRDFNVVRPRHVAAFELLP